MKNIIKQKLNDALSPEILEVIDESDQHAGHSGWREGGNTHFNVKIKATALDGKSRVMQHKMIMGELKDEFASTLHALSINILR
ncbi:MAG: BolA family transcriptional regulator [OCS116 cluster bacterium]|nr:BolA family transcriptional regulator [OCS116 cluster bacterium]